MSKRIEKRKDTSLYVQYCNYIWISIPFLVVIFLSKMFLPDSDAWFLITTGKHIIETGEVTTINPFVIHEGFSIIIQQWVVDILNYIVYDNFGTKGMFVWAILFLVVSNILLFKYLSYYTDNVKLRSWIMVLSSFLLFSFANTRPTSFSLPILLTELIILEEYDNNKKSNLIWLIPVLSLVLINCHAALWLFIFVLMMPYIVPGLNLFRKLDNVKEHLKEYKKLLLVMIPSFLVGFLNPNGLRGILYIYYSYSEASAEGIIAELKAASVMDFIGCCVIVSAIIIAFYIYKNRENLNWKNIYLALGTYLLAAKHSRNVWFIILGIAPLVALLFKDVIKDTVKVKYKENEYKMLSIVYTLAIVVAFIIINPAIPYDEVDTNSVPVSAADYLDKLPEDKKDDIILFTGFNNGAYMEWRGYKVYMDARPELFQEKVNGKEDIYSEYLEVYNGEVDYKAFIDKYKFTHIIVDKEGSLKTYLQYSDEYEEVIHIEEQYILFEKKTFND